MINKQFLTCLFLLIFTLNFANGQEIRSRASIIKAYPLSAIKDEFRVGFEKELKNGKSIEFGGGYLYRIFEWNNCNDCSYQIPGYIMHYGKGITLRVNWNSYIDSTKNLSGKYSSLGLMYKFFTLDDREFGRNLPHGYYYTRQHALYLQRIIGKQFIKNNFVTNFYGGVSICGKLNYIASIGPSYPLNKINNNPRLGFGFAVNLGISFGYKHN